MGPGTWVSVLIIALLLTEGVLLFLVSKKYQREIETLDKRFTELEKVHIPPAELKTVPMNPKVDDDVELEEDPVLGLTYKSNK